jgi:hypothetical protein
MTSHLPIQLRYGTAAFVSRLHAIAGHDEVAWDSIQSVVRTFTPKESPARGCGKFSRVHFASSGLVGSTLPPTLGFGLIDEFILQKFEDLIAIATFELTL